MKKFYTFLYFIVIVCAMKAQSPVNAWVKTFTSPGYNAVGSIVTDHNGNIIVTTTYNDVLTVQGTTLAGAASTENCALLKFDAQGQLLWSQVIGDSGDEFTTGKIAIDLYNNIYITGGFSSTSLSIGGIVLTTTVNVNSQGFLAAFDSQGVALWAKKISSSNNISGRSVALDSIGNIYVTGQFMGLASIDSYTLIGNSGNEIFVAKYDASGNAQWARRAGGNGGEFCHTIAVDRTGNIYTIGNFYDPIPFGSTTLTSNGYTDPFFLKYDSNGNFLFARNLGSKANDGAYTAGLDAQNNLYIAGSFYGSTLYAGNDSVQNTSNNNDMFVVKYDPAGNVLWLKSFGGTGNDNIFGIHTETNGDSYLTGDFDSPAINFGSQILQNTSPPKKEALLFKINSNGIPVWVVASHCALDQHGFAVTSDVLTNIYLVGQFQNCIDFGTTASTPYTSKFDVFLTKFSGGNGDLMSADQLEQSERIQIFPNPANDMITIATEGNETELIVSIVNALGEMVQTKQVTVSENIIYLDQLPAGVYLLQIKNKQWSETKKLIKY